MRRKNNDNFLIILSLLIASVIIYYLYNITDNDIIIVNNINKNLNDIYDIVNEIKKQFNDESKEKLSKEFESLGFYLSNHPLEDFKDALDQYKTKLFKDFENSKDKDSFVAGTIMSVKEKKTIKGNSFAIVKFSDLSKVFELFLQGVYRIRFGV